MFSIVKLKGFANRGAAPATAGVTHDIYSTYFLVKYKLDT